MSNKQVLYLLSYLPVHNTLGSAGCPCSVAEREQLLTKCTKPCEASDRGLWSPEEGQILELPDVGAAS